MLVRFSSEMLSKPTIAMPQPASESSSRNSWSISCEARERSTVSARIWAAKLGVKPAPTMARSSSAVRRLLTTKLSSWKNSSLGGQSGELRQNLVGPAVAHHARELGGHRAELAVIRAPPLGHGGLDLQALVPLDQGEVGDREALELGLRAM